MSDIGLGARGLLEREQELNRIDAALGAAAAGAGGALLIEGAAGIGKSRLLARAVETAGELGVRSLAARARELEQGFAFGVVRQLLEAPLRAESPAGRERLLAGAAALAAPVLTEPAGGGEAAGFPLLHGLYWTLANLAEEGPLLLAVDDVHWADAASLEFLAFLAPRLAELPLLLVATTRPAAPDSARSPGLGAEAGIELLRPRPLSPAAVADLLVDGLGAEADPAFAAACREVTGGNPFLLRELLGELAEEGVEPVAGAAAQVRALGPEAVGRVVLADLARLGDDAVALARATAVLETGRLGDAAALAGLTPEAAGAAADDLAAAGILEPGLALGFRHPLVRNAIYADLAAHARGDLHRRAAALLADEETGPEVAAAHLLRTAPAGEEATAELLLEAARRALGRGSPQAAAASLERAAAEPPPPRLRGEVLRTLARAEALAGSAAAIDRYREAIPLLGDVAERCQATRELATIYAMQAGSDQQSPAVAVLEERLADGDGESEEERVALECDLVCFARIGTGVDAAVAAHVERLRGLAEQGWRADSPIGRRVRVRAAYDAAIEVEPLAAVRALLDPALADGRFSQEEPVESAHFPIAAFTLMAADDYAGAAVLIDHALADAQRRGSAVGYSQASAYHSMVALRRGALAEAEADAGAGLAAAQLPESTPLLLACFVDALLEQGRSAEGEEALAAHGHDQSHGETHFFLHLLEARGRLRLAAGEPERALEDLADAVRVQRLLGLVNPALMSARSSAARALLALGRREEAGELAAEELELATRFGAPRAIGIARSVLGLASGGEEGTELLRAAVAGLEGSGAELALARAQVDLGAALRRGGARTEAREELGRGLDGAERCGAGALAGRAREELLASGARPRRSRLSGADSLTASERRVAAMAAEGLSNPEIAQRLFVTRKTVEVHLSRCYRKLGIASREGLGEALAKD